MTPKFPSSCSLYAVSSITTRRTVLVNSLAIVLRPTQLRRYAQQPEASSKAPSKDTRSPSIAKTALEVVQSKTQTDPINPPRSVLPPPLQLPERSQSQNVFYYYFQIGRAYGGFYKEGIKAVWFNYKAVQILRQRITGELGAKDRVDAAMRGLISRSEWQLLARNDHDIGKLPFFGVLVLIFGEWLPLLVPFMPGVVPGTCRIPKQVVGMKVKAEERRRTSFRMGITEPEKEQFADDRVMVAGRPAERAAWPMGDREFVRAMLTGLRDDQLYHLSSTLGLHSTLWDRIQLPPPAFLLRRTLMRRLQYLTLDDKLLSKAQGVPKLTPAELDIACQERGLDTHFIKEPVLRSTLQWWLKWQEEDQGRGRAMLTMLFKRLALRDWVELNLKANRS